MAGTLAVEWDEVAAVEVALGAFIKAELDCITADVKGETHGRRLRRRATRAAASDTRLAPSGRNQRLASACCTAMEKVANRNVRGLGWEMSSRGHHATPADSPLQDCSPYSHVHVRRERLGCVLRSRTIFCRAVPNPNRCDSQLLHRCITVRYSSTLYRHRHAGGGRQPVEALRADRRCGSGGGCGTGVDGGDSSPRTGDLSRCDESPINTLAGYTVMQKLRIVLSM
jgi:hypothetical protein